MVIEDSTWLESSRRERKPMCRCIRSRRHSGTPYSRAHHHSRWMKDEIENQRLRESPRQERVLIQMPILCKHLAKIRGGGGSHIDVELHGVLVSWPGPISPTYKHCLAARS
ncbi:hypothetical protein RRG08_056078 [Elysia crispata]|uniref:Uncharacterized protein n=1 Tax=Elysia crispata TaxID=231223 RepID=A0AAE0ZBM2_9GAST|nr:hypothetical protein RRG08_056078 [Elysia crispata]